MEYVVIGLVALVVAALTLFSGFGLGTLLMPAFALFFPVDVAVAATAVVHLANNVFRVVLLHRSADRSVLLRFGVPAVVTALLGAFVLARLSGGGSLVQWRLGPLDASITTIKLVMGGLILLFALLDLLPGLSALRVAPRWLPVGGALSGFFGGLSGHQGALRAAFLRPVLPRPATFAATQAVLACMVDCARLVVYGAGYLTGKMAGVSGGHQWTLVAVASACALVGTLLGRRLLPRVTVDALRLLTGTLLLVVGAALVSGLV